MLKKYLLLVYFFCHSSVNAFSSENIVYVDLDYLFNNSNLGKKIISNLKVENQKNIENIKKKDLILVGLEQDLIKKKNILSKEEFDKKFLELKSKIKIFSEEKKKVINNFELKKNKQIKNFFKKIDPILKKYMKDNSIQLILDKKNIILADSKLEITEIIRKTIDKNFN